MRTIIVYCAFAAHFCSTTLSSTIPTNSESAIRLPIHDDENGSDVNSDISDIFTPPPRDTKNPWSRLRNKIVVKIFGSGEKHHGTLSHPHFSSKQKPLGETTTKKTPPYSRHQNDVVLRFNISTTAEASALAEAAEILFLDVWSATKDHADIRVDKDVVPSLLGLLPDSLQDKHARLMHDLAATVRETFPGTSDGPSNPLSPHSLSSSSTYRPAQSEHFFSNYQPITVINPWMKLLRSLFPGHVEHFTIGKTFEGRDINGLKISKGSTDTFRKRSAIIVTGASHAREWISVSTVCYLAHAFITGYRPRPFNSKEETESESGDKEITRLVENFDWYFIPTLNVDGYVYTWTEDRLWRKNRQPTSLGFCKGIELDRSYSFKWGGQSQNNPCSENYPGEKEFEAFEAKNFAAWAKNLTTEANTNIVGFLDLHSYSQQILYPYSYTCGQLPPDLENLEELAEGLAKAIRLRHGEHYEVSSACQGGGQFAQSDKTQSQKKSKKSKNGEDIDFVLTETGGGGSALDYFYREIGVPYSYQIKLRDQGSYGFLLPKDSIKPTGEEIESMVKSFGSFLIGDN